jgi:hypothetical protein
MATSDQYVIILSRAILEVAIKVFAWTVWENPWICEDIQ